MAEPDVTYFKPRSVPLGELGEVSLSVEGFEALRLADVNGLSHETAAAKMNVSRQTFGRLLCEARRGVAMALAEGLALKIQGGHYALAVATRSQISTSGPDSPPGKVPTPVAAGTGKKEPRAKEDRNMAKIAISSEGPGLDEALDPRFGRAAGFVVVDPQTLDFEYLDNGSSQAMAQGAGIQAAEIVAGSGAEYVLTGYVGPKAFRALQAAGVNVGQNLANMTVRDALERFVNGQVDWAQQPNRRGHGR
jgi:predicted DNA-binding protein (UPF0251 family)/predicted Fe-Mo cluster-binding NifX family protein